MSDVRLDVYLFFPGTCREAMEFYQDVFGGELTVQTHGEAPGEPMPGMENKVMHALLDGGDVRLMASDSTRTEPYGMSFISLSLGGTDEAKLRGIFAQLAEGGTVTSELKKEFWGDIFGAVTDRFGVEWMVNISQRP